MSSIVEPMREVEHAGGEERERLSSLIERIFDAERGETSIGKLMSELDHHGIALVLIVFSLPSALPVPAPGYSTILSIPLLFIGFGLLFGKKAIAFPNFISNKKLNLSKLSKLTAFMKRISVFLERFSKPRFSALVRSQFARILIGALICLLGLSMAIPIPGTNTLPAGGIFLIGFSFLEDDAFFLVVGVLWSFLALCFTTLVIVLGVEGAKYLIKSIIGLSSSSNEVASVVHSFAQYLV